MGRGGEGREKLKKKTLTEKKIFYFCTVVDLFLKYYLK